MNYWYTTKIQSLWKSYKVRKILKNIYIKLPEEIQKKIIFFIRENFLIKKYHHNVIEKIIYKKTDNYMNELFMNKYEPIISSGNIYNQNLILNRINILLGLYNKYFSILKNKKMCNDLYNYCNHIIIVLRLKKTIDYNKFIILFSNYKKTLEDNINK